MRKHAFLALALAAVGSVIGCQADATDGGSLSSGGAMELQTRAFARLQCETSQDWSFIQHDRFRTPMHLSAPRTGKPLLSSAVSAEKTTRAFLAEYKDLYRMRDPETELRLDKLEVDTLAMTHVRFQQTVRGVPVVGAELFAHYDRAGHLTSIDATYVPELHGLDVEPSAKEGDARLAVLADVRARMRDVEPSAFSVPEGKLVVFALGEGPARLAWEYQTRAVFSDHPAIWVTTVDAKTGAIIDVYDNLQTVEASGTGVLGDTKKFQVAQSPMGYAMVDTSRGVPIRTYSAEGQEVGPDNGASPVTSGSLNAWDDGTVGPGAAVDAHAFAAVVFDYYKKVHARNAIDGAGGAMDSTAHFGQDYDNAFWDGTGMSYGDGGQYFKPLSAGLDVVAHEFTHGVTQATSALRYQGQPGALNEAVSDIFGAMIEHSIKPDDTKNWQMGEVIVKKAGLIRDFKNPSVGQQPAHMTKLVQTQQDNGGVHINSGIVNNAAFLMTAGGTNPVSNVKVEKGIGWEKSEKLWYRANTTYFTSSTTFAMAAQATMQAAKDLGLTEEEQNIVDCAWKATGVVQGACVAIAPQARTPSTSSPEEGSVDAPSSPSDQTAEDPGTGTTTTTEPTTKRRSLAAQNSGCSMSTSSLGSSESPWGLLLVATLGLAFGRRRSGRS
ncbi:Zinc metalloproteinase precursor [Labilithrix luteola]|uniref:Neutral metalloproteinase n=1 Tax=Labilithrix luteola TaxID=1391654 RepID=A0A0K1PYS2_9BACT|nr:M4 family metallopeptidase [Labilithrix luteola]AKU98647.1 Zinc metalloproteinase precursor [Labilithrix luteola]